MSLKAWSAVATLVLLTSGCAATVPVAPPAASATESATTLYAITDAELASLSDEQFAALSDLQIAALSQSQVASLSESRRAAMTPSQRMALLLAQFTALTIPQVKALPPALFAALTPAQLSTLTPVHAQALTPEQLAALSSEQAAAVASASAAPEDAEGPSKALPPSPPGLAPGLYVHVIDGLIQVANPAGAQNFSAGQFGFVPSFKQPPIVVPRNPGIQFVPPPVFNSATPPNATPVKSNAVDCEVRYVAMQNAPVSQPVNTTVNIINTATGTSTPPAVAPSTAPTSDAKDDTKTGAKTDAVKKTYCN